MATENHQEIPECQALSQPPAYEALMEILKGPDWQKVLRDMGWPTVPVEDAWFLGRDAEMRTIEEAIANGQSIHIAGEGDSGKTSVLKAVQKNHPASLWLDIQGHEFQKHDELISWLQRTIQNQLRYNPLTASPIVVLADEAQPDYFRLIPNLRALIWQACQDKDLQIARPEDLLFVTAGFGSLDQIKQQLQPGGLARVLGRRQLVSCDWLPSQEIQIKPIIPVSYSQQGLPK